MKRMIAVFMAALFMMAVMVVMAAPAFAKSDNACCKQINGGDKEPKGAALGVPAKNKGGNEPPGKQPKRGR